MIDIQPLAILREIHRTGSLTQAAEQLCLTQSAVSHAIRRFEERHSVKLLEREGHKLRFTLAGTYLLDLAQRVLPQLEHGAGVLEDYAVAVAAPSVLAWNVIPVRTGSCRLWIRSFLPGPMWNSMLRQPSSLAG